MRAPVLALGLLLAGCVADLSPTPASVDAPASRPALFSGLHNVSDLPAFRDALVARSPAVATPFVLGASVRGEEILGVRLTAPGDASARIPVLVDGGIHGNEVFGAETGMYLAAWLVENYGRNATATRILETTEVHVVLLLNPDGRVAMTRTNANGVDLNRNSDVDFGNPDPTCRSQSISPLLPYYYAGPRAFSEPETAALRDSMAEIEPRLYVSHHTGRPYSLIRPWSACQAPHEMPAEHDAVYEAIESWARNHTKYAVTGTAAETAQRLFPPGAASGSTADWCYLAHGCVAITLEVTHLYGDDPEGDPVAIAEDALPITLHLLTHASDYAAWRAPDG